MNFHLKAEHLEMVRDYPHLLGHLVGKTKLTELHSQWIWEVWGQPDGEHTANQAHRGAFKTTSITEIGAMWWLLFHPSDRIALIRETFTAANETLTAIKSYMSTEAIQAVFALAHGSIPKAKKSRDGQVLYNFKRTITKEASIGAYGIEQVPTGSHFDRIICDDIVTINSRLSKAKRERVKEGVREVMTNIVDPGKTVMFTGTPWHHDDAWALKDEEGNPVIPAPKKYTPEDTGILTPEQLAEKKRRTTKALFSINYMLDTSVKDEGQIFEDPIYGRWDGQLPAYKYYAHLDAKFDGSCTNALTIMAQLPDGRIQARGWTFPEHVEEKIGWIRQTLGRYRCSRLCIETNPDKGFLAKRFKAPDVQPIILVRAYHEAMNKDIKIISYLKHYWQDIVWAEDTDKEYMLQILDYRQGQDPRDCPDSAASLLRQVFFPVDKRKGNGILNTLD